MQLGRHSRHQLPRRRSRPQRVRYSSEARASPQTFIAFDIVAMRRLFSKIRPYEAEKGFERCCLLFWSKDRSSWMFSFALGACWCAHTHNFAVNVGRFAVSVIR